MRMEAGGKSLWLKLVRGVLALGLISGLVQTAQGEAFATAGTWTISKFDSKTCVAVNRPGDSLDIAPFNALLITQGPRAKDITLEVFFWPGAFKENQTGKLLVSDGQGPKIKYDAVAVKSYAFRTIEPVRIADLRRLAVAPMIHFSTPLVRQELRFDIKYLDRTLDYLDACHANL